MTAPRLNIIDATLREGAQTPGVRFDAAASGRIAGVLDRLGVDMIECGHPAAGAAEQDRIAAAAEAAAAPILVHARARVEDVLAAAATAATWVGVFIGVNAVSRAARLSPRVAAALPQHIVEAVAEAKARGLKVRFTVEDASRTEMNQLLDAYSLAVEAGADRVCWADTVGVARPSDVKAAVMAMRLRLPDAPIELHLHNDRGLALAAALEGWAAGADWVASTVNGIGERCGIVDTLQLLINLRLECAARDYPTGAAMRDARDTVALATGLTVAPQHACTGGMAFTHEAALHRAAVERDAEAYQAFDPAWVGAKVG